MIVFGAIDFAAALVRVGRFLGYHVTVCDARPVFATAARFPDADEIVVDWPHRYLAATRVDARTVLCVLTHDAKFDIPLLELALRLPVAYVGAMGSRRTHLERNERLRGAACHRSSTGRAPLADRARPRSAYAGGDRTLHRRRDRRRPARRQRTAPEGRAHPDPPRGRTAARPGGLIASASSWSPRGGLPPRRFHARGEAVRSPGFTGRSAA